ncbi:MAG: SDR family NAD(P)-dependent oxidoreductase [Cyanobacteriota bacterium]|nr:SDR family NAD(P)-dependent oxidoreductase [Cyanobacteriota bacterium]
MSPCRPRTLLVSGANRGIGRAIAHRLLSDGHRLSLGLRQPEQAASWLAAGAIEGQLHLHPYDALASTGAADGAEAWVEDAQQRFGQLDGVVHCAGLFSRVGLCFAPGELTEIRQLLDVNLMGPWRVSRAAWPHLVASGDGRVITLVSMSGVRVKGGLAAYSASKFALMALCQTMRNEGWEQGIRVTAICPSWVNTAMAAAVTALPKEAMTQPEDLAASVSHLLQLPASAVPFELRVSCQLEQ